MGIPRHPHVHARENATMAKHDEVTTHEHELAEYLQERIKPGLNRGAIPLLARSIAKEIVRREHLNGGSDDPEPDGEYDEKPDAEADDEPELEAGGEDDVEAEADDDADHEPDDEPTAEADDEPDLEAGGEDNVEAEADDDSDDELDAEADDEPDAEADHEPTAEADEEPDDESESPLDEFEAEMHDLQAELGEDWIVRFSVQGDDAWLTAEKQDGSQHVEAPTAEVLAEAVELLNESGGRSG
jgi:hypothetical protein